MHIRFEDQVLRRLAAEPTFAPEGWDEPEIRHFRLVAQCAQAAQVADDLHATRVLRIRPNADGQSGTWFVQLSSSRRLFLAFGTGTTYQTVMFSVLSMEMEKTV